MKLVSHLLAIVFLAPCFSFCDGAPLTEKAALERGEKAFADFLKEEGHLQRTDFDDPTVRLDEDGAAVEFRRRGFPDREPVAVLLGRNGCISVSGTP